MFLLLQTDTVSAPLTADALAARAALVPGLAPVVAWLNEHPLVATAVGVALLAAVSWIALVVVRKYLVRLLHAVARRTPTFWDQVLFDRSVFHRLAAAVPVLIVSQGVLLVPNVSDGIARGTQRVCAVLLVLVFVRAFSAFLSAVGEIYNRYPASRDRPIKGYLQVLAILAWIAGGILMVSTLMDRSPLIFFSGLGAMTAILLLVFRDSLLSLVAGVQLTANNLIRVGDWIEMPQFSADGDVVDIALNSVTVQNWDRTLTVIPTHKFLEHSFKNWRGMSEAGGRRIKRSVHVDMTTIRFLDAEQIARFRRFALLRDYVDGKVREIEEYNRAHCADPDFAPNARRMTNVGMLRAYMVAYLRQHPHVHQGMTFLVRQLAPTPEGLPLEIYVFSSDIRWNEYEGIQADVFDHMLAMIPEFGLRVYQKPSGADLTRLALPASGKEAKRVSVPAMAGGPAASAE
jgi:miniconductance mechanosensitive channel